MITRLQGIADIQTGVFRKPDIQGEIIYFQVKHFDNEGRLISPTLLSRELKNDDSLKNHLLKHKDILFAAKGPRNFASLYNHSIGPATASTTFFVIRLKNEAKIMILPEYILWFLNHPHTTSFLKSNAKGGSIPSISKVTLSQLEIPIPDLQVQEKILQIDQLRKKEKELTRKILQKKQELYLALTYQAANKEMKKD